MILECIYRLIEEATPGGTMKTLSSLPKSAASAARRELLANSKGYRSDLSKIRRMPHGPDRHEAENKARSDYKHSAQTTMNDMYDVNDRYNVNKTSPGIVSKEEVARAKAKDKNFGTNIVKSDMKVDSHLFKGKSW